MQQPWPDDPHSALCRTGLLVRSGLAACAEMRSLILETQDRILDSFHLISRTDQLMVNMRSGIFSRDLHHSTLTTVKALSMDA